MSFKDDEILKLLNSHDENGLKLMFELYYKPLVVFSLKYISSFETAEDIVQDLFIRIWDEKKYKTVSSSLKSYLFASARNSSLNYLKKNTNINIESIDKFENELVFEEHNMIEIEERREQLLAEVEKLSPKTKLVFEAIVLEGLKYKSVAELLGVSVNTVKTHYSRALKTLRKSLNIIVILLLP
jgi:RNA polymerase sigma-70 factor (family 1)